MALISPAGESEAAEGRLRIRRSSELLQSKGCGLQIGFGREVMPGT